MPLDYKDAVPVINTSPGAEFTLANRQWQGVPGIEVADNGRLWATWYSGGEREPREDNYILLATSNNKGETWIDPVAVVSPEDKSVRAFDPVLWRDNLGRLWWFWSQCADRVDGRYGVWATCTEDAGSESPRWSTPRRICDGIMMNKPAVLSDGRWALPVTIWSTEKLLPEYAEQQFSNMIVSEDQGESFKYLGSADVPERSYDEHHIVELPDNKLWMLVRTRYGIGQSFSVDGGTTWSPGEKSNLTGPDSRFCIRRLQSGKLLLVNHATTTARSHLTAWLSDNNGKNWYGGLLLDERVKVTYPDATQASDGLIYVIYDYNRYSDKGIFMAILTEDDIAQGKCVHESSIIKHCISPR